MNFVRLHSVIFWTIGGLCLGTHVSLSINGSLGNRLNVSRDYQAMFGEDVQPVTKNCQLTVGQISNQ
jgi:hypothetical protein